jgi:heat shock protein HslJ
MKMPSALSLALLLLLVTACSSGGAGSPSPEPVPDTLAGTAWKAVSVGGRATVAGREPKLAFDANKVTGSGGCNQFGGDYTYADVKLTFGEMPMTLMGCEEPIGSIESAFVKLLGGGVTVRVDDGGQILLEGPAGQPLLVPAAR